MRGRLLTARQAATVVGVPLGTVRFWREAGLLEPHARHGKALVYWEGDVLRAEVASRRRDPTRRRARRLADELDRQAG